MWLQGIVVVAMDCGRNGFGLRGLFCLDDL